ncbi:MAG: NAD(P)-dependent oxidoreductase [Verrucomicrobiota bacterium]
MKKVLVTGASGFIGFPCLSHLLDRGYEVHGVYRSLIDAGDDRIRWHNADLLNPEETSTLIETIQPTHLLHLAWFVVAGRQDIREENMAWVKASLDLLFRFHEQGGRRVVMVGSGMEYDWGSGLCEEETTPIEPQNFYGVCKHSVHTTLKDFVKDEDLSYAWARPFFIYGPREDPKRLVSHVIRALLQKERAPCSHGRQVRDYLFVDDVASALVALLDHDVEGAFNIGSSQPLSLREVLRPAVERLGGEDLVRFGEIPSSPDEAPEVVASTEKIRNTIGWQPRHTLEEGMEKTIAWWRSHLPV